MNGNAMLPLVRLHMTLEMTRTFQAFISKTREVDRDDREFQFAAQSCHDALTCNLCVLRDQIRPELEESDPEILESGPMKVILAEIQTLESHLGK